MNRYATRPTLRHLLTPLGAAFALATGGCDGSELVRPIDESAGAVPAVGIDFAFQVGAETVGFGADAVSLDRAAEDPAYFGTRGFQVDVGAVVVGQPAGGLLRLTLDGEVLAETQGAGALVVGGLFRGVTLPYQAEPLNVELAYFRTAVGEDGNAIPDETPALRVAKAVTLTGDPATCEVTVDVGATEAGCAPLTVDPASGEPGNLGVAWRVTRTAGACDTLSGTVSGPDGVVLGALEGTFDPDGVASGFFALGPALDAEAAAARYSQGVTFAVTATDSDASDGLDAPGQAELTVQADNTPPDAAFLVPTPTEGQAVVRLEDDADPATDGLQLAPQGRTTAEDAVTATLSRDGTAGEPVALAGPGDFSFPVETFAGDSEVAFTLAVADACGNVALVEQPVRVLATPGAIAVSTPAIGALLLARDDADPATRFSYESEVVVGISGATPGLIVNITCDGLVSGLVVGSLTIAEVSEDGTYAVPVAIPVDALGAEVTCTATTSLGTSSAPVSLVVALPAPTLTVLAPIDAGDGPVCLNAPAVAMSLAATDLDGQEVTARVGETAAVLGLVAEGVLEAELQLPDGTPDGLVTIDLDATDARGNVVSDTQGPTRATVRVDRAAPAIFVTAPAANVLRVAETPDADAATAGYQVVLSGTYVDAALSAGLSAGGEVCLLTADPEGGEPARGPCATVDASGTWQLAARLARGANLLTLQATDDCGNVSGESGRVIRLESDFDLAVTSPADGAVMLAAEDGVPATGDLFEAEMAVTAPFVSVGDTLTALCRTDAEGAVETAVGSLTVAEPLPADRAFTLSVAVPVGAIGPMTRCRVEQTGGETLTSEALGFTFAIPAPTLAFTAPDAACFNTDAVAFSGTATGLDGATLTLASEGALGAVTVDAGAFFGAFDAATLPEGGPFTLSAEGADGFGNPVSAVATFSLDRVAPVLTRVAPALVVDPFTDADASPNPGFQADVVLAVDDASLAGAEVCLALGADAPTCVPVTGPQVTFPAVTLQPRTNSFVATVVDGCGTPGVDLAFDVEAEMSALTATITAPAASFVTASETLALTARATDPDDGAPLAGGTARLWNGETQIETPFVDNGDGTYTFPAVPLAAGETVDLAVEIDVGFLTGVSSPRSVRQKDVAPTIAITAPVAGFLNLASPCSNAGQGCVTNVTVATTDVEDGSAIRLALTCPGVATTLSRSATGDAATFAGVAFSEGLACDLVATVTDAAGQEATSTTVRVTADRQGPSVSLVNIPTILQTNQDTDNTLAGIQRALQVSTVDAGAGQPIAVRFDWVELEGPRTRTVTATAVEGQTAYDLEDVAGSGVVTWPDGLVTLTATVLDRAGNPATATANLTVSSATVAISSPASVESSCETTCAVGFCFGGECWRGWGLSASRNLTVNLAGLATSGSNARVCSDHPSLAAAAAAPCITPNSATGAYRQVLAFEGVNGSNIVALGSALPDGYQRLVVEAQPLSLGGWVTSANAVLATQRQRRVFVDLTAPVVSAVTSPSDTLAPTGALNAAEAVAAPRAFTIRFAADEAGSASYFVNDATTPVRTDTIAAAGSYSADLDLPEGNPSVWVVVTDRVGNASPASPGVGATVYQPLVDVTAPTLAFTRPSSSPINALGNRDVALTSDAEGMTVAVSDDGVQVATAVVTGGAASFPHAAVGLLSDGSHRLTAVVADAAGNSRTAATTPALVTVDTQPPSATLSAPADNAVFDDLDDASPAFGYQVDLAFGAGDGAVSWELATQTNCDATFTTCDGEVPVSAGAVTNAGGAEPGIRINAPLTDTTTRFRVVLRTTDAAGNVTTAANRVTVTSTACQVLFTNLPNSSFFNVATCPGGAPCAATTFVLGADTAGFCPADTIELRLNGVTVDSAPLASFDGDFNLSLTDGLAAELELRLTATGATVASNTATRTVDFSPPVVTFVARDVDGFMTAASDATVVYGTARDLEPGAEGLQLHAALDVSDANAAGGSLAGLTATSGGTTVNLVPSNVTLPLTLAGASPVATDLRSLTLADGNTWTVTASASDAAGNTGTASFTAIVDVTRPGAVTITGASYDPRGTRFDPLSWTAVGNNGAGGGAATEYAVRYSAQPITEANWDSACDFQDVYGSEGMPAAALPGEPMEAALGGPDSRAFSDACKLRVRFQTTEAADTVALYVGVRAVDGAGNLSPLGAGSVTSLTNGQLWIGMTRIRFDNTASGFGAMTAAAFAALTVSGATLGDVNGDARTDIGLGITASNLACVVAGHAVDDAGETLTTLSGANHACITPATAAAVVSGIDRVGDQVIALGDVNGDGRRDFGITARRAWTAPWVGVKTQREGLIFVYLGRTGGAVPNLATPDVVIRGLTTQTTTVGYTSACGSGDLNGDGREDIGVGEPSLNNFHVVPGSAAWQPVASGGTPITVDLAPAAGVADAGGFSIGLDVSGGSPLFGGRCGRAGDVLDTPAGLGNAGLGDVIVTASGTENGRVFVFPGRLWTAGQVRRVSQSLEFVAPNYTDEDRVSVRLRQENDGIQANSVIGVDFQGGQDVTGDGVPDVLAVTSNRRPAPGGTLDGKTVYVFNGARLAALVRSDARVDIGANPLVGQSWTGANGWVIRADPPARFGATRFHRLTGAVFMTPAAYEPPHLFTTDFSGTASQLASNHLDTPSGVTLGQFPVQDGVLGSIYRSGNISVGGWHGGGADFTGDGELDIIEGTNYNELLIVR